MAPPLRAPSAAWLAIAIVALFLVPGPSLGATVGAPSTLGATPAGGVRPSESTGASAPVSTSWSPIADSELAMDRGAEPLPRATVPNADLQILLTLSYSNASALNQFLVELSNPSSPSYHEYLTASEFDARFSPTPRTYAQLETYLRSRGATNLENFDDRTSIAFEASPAAVQSIFNTQMELFRAGPAAYEAPASTPELPSNLASSVSSVEGLSTNPALVAHIGLAGSEHRVSLVATPTQPVAGGYLPPATYDGAQMEYAPDFQVAYDEQSLFDQAGYPTNTVVATILWAGNYTGSPISTKYGSLTTGELLGSFVPDDVYDFYNETLPSGEPHATVRGVPLGGAPSPGPLASWDSIGAVFENTLDLEMVGSTAPGAQIYNVYDKFASYVDLDTDFSFILSPNATEAALGNVSVISNSWYGADSNDSGWYSDLQQAQARGITVLACSGDSDDNTASSKYFGSQAAYPGTESFNDFGTTSVGGSEPTLSTSTLHITSEEVWNISAKDTADGGPAGSEGGISSVFKEPSWQTSSEANSVIAGAGRGVPDLSAEANNTLITITVDGDQYIATNASGSSEPFEWAWGTSIATPLTAGMIATMDSTMSHYSQPDLGFLNPDLYNISTRDYASPTLNQTRGYYAGTGYNSSLPMLMMTDTTSGSNYKYAALAAYDLVTGWGTLDAYNYTQYMLQDPAPGSAGQFSSVNDDLFLSGLKVSSPSVSYNASFQQNFFVADAMGAPICWVQNVIYLTGGSKTWDMEYTGWLVYPFYGQYPDAAGYEYEWPVLSHSVTLPSNFNITTTLINSPGLDDQVMKFYVGPYTVVIPLPGASYILGDLWYNYSWQGSTYENGPFAPNAVPGGLSPQFGLVGGPSGGNGSYTSGTKGSINVLVSPTGPNAGTYYAPDTKIVTPAIDETGEDAHGVSYTKSTQNNWTVGYTSGDEAQGVLAYEPPTLYPVTVTETGLPAGTKWFFNLTGGQSYNSTTSTINFDAGNGSYNYVVPDAGGYVPTPSKGSFTVSGGPAAVTISFSKAPPKQYGVEFTESGLPASTSWAVTLAGTPMSSTTTSLFFPEANGKYAYTVGTVSGYTASPKSGNATVSNANVTVPITFTPVGGSTYTASFTETGLTAGTSWSVTLNAVPASSTTASIAFTGLANGAYPYTVGSAAGYTVSPTSGSVTIAGANASVSITFTAIPPTTYAVTFSETGLPSGTLWTVIWNGSSYGSNLATLSITGGAVNGTYAWTMGAVSGWHPRPTGGSQPINGGPATIPVQFTQVDYLVTVSESGLPSGSSWSVTLNGSLATQSTASFTEEMPNGTYAYSVDQVSGYTASPSSGALPVDGAPATLSIDFSSVPPPTYSVTFTETGLSSGTTWSVALDGTTHSSSSADIVFSGLVNGTYSYSVKGVSGYIAASPTGSAVVKGANALESISFSVNTLYYAVDFTETGLGSGVSWSITLNGTTLTSQNSTVDFSETNGTYSFAVATVSGYTVNESGGTISVSGSLVSVPLAFTAHSSSNSPSGSASSWLLWGLLAVIVLAAIIAAVVLSRRKKEALPPQGAPPPYYGYAPPVQGGYAHPPPAGAPGGAPPPSPAEYME